MIPVYKYPKPAEWQVILKRPELNTSELHATVEEIITGVRLRGDAAVNEYSEKFDKVKLDTLLVPENEILQASVQVKEDLKKSIETARRNIEKFHSVTAGFDKVVVTVPGIRCWQKTVPIEKVGLYIPGGKAPLISTVLMLGVPAVMAGCTDIILCTPPDHNGHVHPAILYTASILGINRIFRVGGVQAIAAMAYGTETIPKVYKIFGPGNQYVNAAKQLVGRETVAIDLPAGPSELAVIADNSANPVFVAADLLSQAEHGDDSQVLFVTSNEQLIDQVLKEIAVQIGTLPRHEIARKALKNSKVILLENEEDIIRLVNDYAPEHLIINTLNCQELGTRIINAGSVFLGQYAPESAGDYASGTNHTLPTNGAARAYSGISVDSFQKKISFQEISEYGLYNIQSAIITLADAEGFTAHRNSVSLRLKKD
jgi:histidinol dehydrogenase